MSNNSEPQEKNFLGTFASLLGLLSIALYYSGWIYRWAYYGFYNIEITSINLALESFFIVTIQVFLSSFSSAIFFVISCFFICLMGVLCNFLVDNFYVKIIFLFKSKRIQSKLRRKIINKAFKNFVKDIIIVAWILITLFQISKARGIIDAKRDFSNESSKLPIITVVASEDYPLGRNVKNPFIITDKEDNLKVLGDIKRYMELSGRELNDAIGGRVWRLLLEDENRLYIVETMPEKMVQQSSPITLQISKSGDGALLILTNEVAEP
ncbi:hypothetical protein [Sphaerothrix gracilis]|uniref:hypothetical protein n=1 Tax=Sphaerothrix gracilis TaxID=3151835 RepID=UPI0031FE37A3